MKIINSTSKTVYLSFRGNGTLQVVDDLHIPANGAIILESGKTLDTNEMRVV